MRREALKINHLNTTKEFKNGLYIKRLKLLPLANLQGVDEAPHPPNQLRCAEPACSLFVQLSPGFLKLGFLHLAGAGLILCSSYISISWFFCLLS